MEEPVEPRLADFGLSEAEFVAVPKQKIDFTKVAVATAGLLTIYAFISLYGKTSFAAAFLICAFLFGPLSFFGGALLAGLLVHLESSWLRRTNILFRKAEAFNKAVDTYQKKKIEYENWLRKLKEDWWRALPGIAFEEELGKLFASMGFEVSHTPRSGDGGVDLLVKQHGRLTVVQCKAHNKRIPIGVARELAASMRDFGASDAILACFEGVTRPTEEYIKDKPIMVLTVPQIVELQKQQIK